MSTFLQLSQQLWYELKLSGTAPSAVTGQVGVKRECCRWIAESAYQIEMLWTDWEFLWTQWSQSTTADTANYSNSSTVRKWDTESFTLDGTTDSYVRLVYIKYKKWRDAYSHGDKDSGKPWGFTVLPDKSVTLEPPPDDVYTLTADYWIAPTKMTGNSDTPSIPTRFERIIIARAKMMYAEQYGDQDILATAGAEYNLLLKKLEGEELPDRQDTMSQGEFFTMVLE